MTAPTQKALLDYGYLSFSELKERGQGQLATEGHAPDARAGQGARWDYPGRVAQVVLASEHRQLDPALVSQAGSLLDHWVQALSQGVGGLVGGELGAEVPGPPGRLEAFGAALDGASGGAPFLAWLDFAEDAVERAPAALPSTPSTPAAAAPAAAAPLGLPAALPSPLSPVGAEAPAAPVPFEPSAPPPAPPPAPPQTAAPPPWALAEARRLIQADDRVIYDVAARLPGVSARELRGRVAQMRPTPWFHAVVANHLVAVRTARAQRIAHQGAAT